MVNGTCHMKVTGCLVLMMDTALWAAMMADYIPRLFRTVAGVVVVTLVAVVAVVVDSARPEEACRRRTERHPKVLDQINLHEFRSGV